MKSNSRTSLTLAPNPLPLLNLHLALSLLSFPRPAWERSSCRSAAWPTDFSPLHAPLSSAEVRSHAERGNEERTS